MGTKRDSPRPPTVAAAIRERSPSNSVAGGEPGRAGDLVWFVWPWQAFQHPLGYGVRVPRYDGEKLDMDVRFAMRPWE